MDLCELLELPVIEVKWTQQKTCCHDVAWESRNKVPWTQYSSVDSNQVKIDFTVYLWTLVKFFFECASEVMYGIVIGILEYIKPSIKL